MIFPHREMALSSKKISRVEIPFLKIIASVHYSSKQVVSNSMRSDKKNTG